MRKKRRFFTDSTTFDVAYLIDGSSSKSTRHIHNNKDIKRDDDEKKSFAE